MDPGCTCRDIDGSVTIHVTKSPVSLLYPLTYVRTVNYFPIEKVQYTNTCEDGALVENPTCGWYYIDGERAEDSQVRSWYHLRMSFSTGSVVKVSR